MDEQVFDVVVVGGGAAGLNAALVLGRARRRVAVVDGGAPRNAPAAHMQGFLSRDGMPPGELLAVGRAEVAGYGVEVIEDQVVRIDHGFFVRLAGGRLLRARRVLVATGVRDVLPQVPGVRERWGRDVLHCPYCHGWEVRDQPFGVLGSQPGAVHQTLLVRQWSDDVVHFTDGQELTSSEHEQLEARGIRVVTGDVARLVIEEDRLTGVELADGRVVARTALFVRPVPAPADDALLARLGCDVDADGCAVVDAGGRTSVFGVWAAGNVVNPFLSVIASAGAGAMAAAALNADLVEEDVDRAVEDHRAAGGTFSAAMEARVSDMVLGDRRHGVS